MSSVHSSLMRTVGGRMATGFALLGVAFSLAACGPDSSSTSSGGNASASRPAAAPSGSATPSSSSPSGGGSAPAPAGTPSLVPMQTASGGEFVSPSGNITCEVSTAKVMCETGSPARSVTMDSSGSYTTCNGDQCLGNAGEGTPTLAYGTATGVGPFVCASASSGVTCTANGKGFTISAAGISSAPGSTSSGTGQAGFSEALAAWKEAASANAATMGEYFQQAATDLKAAGNPGYSTAISELEYLISLPNTDVPSAQRARAHTDLEDLDEFFGTPGLMS